MPLALRDLQAGVAAHLRGESRPDIVSVVVGDSISATARLGIHRHHMGYSLAAVLASTFSTVHALVGESFFRALAKAFVTQTLPVQPVLCEYGDGFPAFIDTYAAARLLPYLGDVARLDWALNVAFNSPPDGRLTAADLASMPADQVPARGVTLVTGTRIVRSRFPIDRIWRTSQPGAQPEVVDLGESGACLLVLRRQDDVAFVEVSEPEAAFLAALDSGASLEAAALAGLAADPAFDLSIGFARLLGLQVFAALR